MVGNSHKTQIAEMVTSAPYHGNIHVGDIFAHATFCPRRWKTPRATARARISRFRTAATIAARSALFRSCAGAAAARRPTQVVEQVRNLARKYREVVLSGINLGRWGREPGSKMRLADLVRLLLAETDGGAAAAEFRRADGLFRRSARSDGGVAADRQARARSVALVAEFTVSVATVMPAPKLAVLVPCTQCVNCPVRLTDSFVCPCCPVFGFTVVSTGVPLVTVKPLFKRDHFPARRHRHIARARRRRRIDIQHRRRRSSPSSPSASPP